MGWYMLLFQASLKMRDSKTGKKVYDFLESAGIRILYAVYEKNGL